MYTDVLMRFKYDIVISQQSVITFGSSWTRAYRTFALAPVVKRHGKYTWCEFLRANGCSLHHYRHTNHLRSLSLSGVTFNKTRMRALLDVPITQAGPIVTCLNKG